jgi:hypothetical protein
MILFLKNRTLANQERITIMSSLKYLRLIILISLSLGILPAIAIPPTPIQATPAIVQSQPPKPELRQLLDDRVKGIMERQHIPGMVVVVIKDGKAQELKELL